MSAQLLLVVGLAGVFLAVVVALGTIGALTAERSAVHRSLAAVEALGGVPSSMRPVEAQPLRQRVLDPLLGRLARTGRRVLPAERAQRIRRRLDVAGTPGGWDVERVGAFKVLGVVVGVLVGLLLPPALGWGAGPTLGLLIGLPVAGWFLPDLVLRQLGARRTQRLRRELPDAMDLLTISVEAGLGFDAALAQVARNTTGPVAEEFARVLQEMQIGLGRTAAFRALGERTDLADLRGFVTAMVQADEFGIPIAEVLRVQSREMRIKRRQRAEEAAQKVPVKILFPLIFFMLPALFVVIAGPGVLQIMDVLF